MDAGPPPTCPPPRHVQRDGLASRGSGCCLAECPYLRSARASQNDPSLGSPYSMAPASTRTRQSVCCPLASSSEPRQDLRDLQTSGRSPDRSPSYPSECKRAPCQRQRLHRTNG